LDEDPSYAAGWLKHLSDRALSWPKTAALADKLRVAGLAHVYPGHRQDVELVAASLDGKYAATGSDDSTIRIWDLANDGGSLELTGHIGPLDAMEISSDSKYLATAGTDHKVILWALADGSQRVLAGHTNTARGVAFSPDKRMLASTSEDGSMFVWDVATATGEKLIQHTHSLRPVAWVDNTRLLVGSFDGSLADVDLTTKKVTWYHEQGAELRSIAVAPDGKLWVTTDEDGQVIVWDAATHRKIRTLARHQDVAREAIITADGRYVITAGGNDEVHVHSLPDGAFHALKGNEAGIKDIDLSPDGLVVSAGIDRTVRIWKLDGTLLHTWRGHAAAVKGCAFVGRRVVTGAEDNMVRVWSLDELPPPPRGPALRGWLEEHTNLTGPASAPRSVSGDD
jgi:WD40 repeat protein